MSETVAKQFLHLSNHPTVTARDGPAEEGEEGRKDEADSRQRTQSNALVGAEKTRNTADVTRKTTKKP